MKHLLFKKNALIAVFFTLFCITAFVGQSKAGLDYYEIYLGKKLVFKRAVNQPLSLQSLPINEAGANEQLTIKYYQCNAPNKLGTKRSIMLKDEAGKTLKEWKFKDSDESNNAMVISVKDLLQLQKTAKGQTVSLFYTAEGRPEGQKLASITASSKTVGYMPARQEKHKQNNITEMQVYNKSVSLIR